MTDWLHQTIRLTKPNQGYRIGTQGVVVDDADDEYALVEIADTDGATLALLDVPYEDLRAGS